MSAYVVMKVNRLLLNTGAIHQKLMFLCCIIHQVFKNSFLAEKNAVTKISYLDMLREWFFQQLWKSSLLHCAKGWGSAFYHTVQRLFNESPALCWSGHSVPKFGLPLKQKLLKFKALPPHHF